MPQQASNPPSKVIMDGSDWRYEADLPVNPFGAHVIMRLTPAVVFLLAHRIRRRIGIHVPHLVGDFKRDLSRSHETILSALIRPRQRKPQHAKAAIWAKLAFKSSYRPR